MAIRVFVSRIITSARASDREGWTPVRWEERQATFGRHNCRPTMDWLEAAGHVECDHKCSIGEKAFWWRLGERWRDAPIRGQRAEDRDTLRLWNAIRGLGPTGEGKPLTPVERHLNRWNHAYTLDPEVVERGMATINGEGQRRRKGRREVSPEVVAERRRGYARMIYELAACPEERPGTRCLYGRFHAILTRMPRWMRGAIRINGRPMVEIDIVACQPLIQAILAARWIATEHVTATTPVNGTGVVSHTRPLTDKSALGAVTPDLIEFFEKYAAGEDFYRWFAGKIEMDCRTDPERDRVKLMWSWLVYDEPDDAAVWRRAWKAFCRSCPSVARWLEAVKQNAGPKPYKEAARTCQRFESRLMIDGVVGELMERCPDMPILTVHDAILVHPENADIVRDAIARVWLREAGFEPRIKIKLSA